MKIDAVNFVIDEIFSQQILHQNFYYHITLKLVNSSGSVGKFGQWHPVILFSKKMMLVEKQYKTYNEELLAIVRAFIT